VAKSSQNSNKGKKGRKGRSTKRNSWWRRGNAIIKAYGYRNPACTSPHLGGLYGMAIHIVTGKEGCGGEKPRDE